MATTPQPRLAAAAVLAMGAASPIGYGVRPMQAAIAGGLRNFQAGTQLHVDGEPAASSRLPEVDESAPRAERIAVLTRMAVVDLLENMPFDLPDRIPVFVGVSRDEPNSDLAAIGEALLEGSQGLIDPQSARIFKGYSSGRIAFLSALSKAIRAIDPNADELALVVATDTRCTWDCLETRIKNRRLLTAKDDGSIPGEAAVLALICPEGSAFALRHARYLVCDPAFGADEFGQLQRSPQATHGLGRAFQALREHPVAGALRATSVVAFESGEVFFTRSFVTGYLRNAELMPEPLRHELIASNVGDTGAAAAGIALVRADWTLHQPDAHAGSRVLIYGHDDDGRCGAAVVIGISAEEERR